MKHNDQDRLEKDLLKGSEHAFHSLFKMLYPSLCLFSKKYVVNSHVAEDIAQDAFVKYWNKRINFNSIPQIKSYLYVTVRNASLNHLRDHAKNTESEILDKEEVEDQISKDIIEEESYRLFYQAVNQLPVQMKSVILYSLKGLKNKEIAEMMEISNNTVHSHKKEAYKRLKVLLKDHYYLLVLFVDVFGS